MSSADTKGARPPTGRSLDGTAASGDVAPDTQLLQLLRRLSTDVGALVRQEISLAKLEIRRSAETLAKESVVIALGGLLIGLGLIILVVFLVLALGAILGGAYWLSTLLIGGILVIAGVLSIRAGRKGIQENQITPTRTIETVRETKEWAEENAARITR